MSRKKVMVYEREVVGFWPEVIVRKWTLGVLDKTLAPENNIWVVVVGENEGRIQRHGKKNRTTSCRWKFSHGLFTVIYFISASRSLTILVPIAVLVVAPKCALKANNQPLALSAASLPREPAPSTAATTFNYSKTKPRSEVSICVWLPLAWRPVSDVPRGGWPVLEVRPALSYLASTDLLCSNSRVCLAYPGLLETTKLSMNSLSASSWTWTLHKNCHSLAGIPCFLQLAEQWALFIYRPSVDPTLSPSVLQASTTPGTHIHLILGVFECLKPRLRIPIGYWSVPLPPSSTLQYRGMATPPSPQLGQKVLHLCHPGHTEWLWQFWWTNIYSPLWALNVTRILDIH